MIDLILPLILSFAGAFAGAYAALYLPQKQRRETVSVPGGQAAPKVRQGKKPAELDDSPVRPFAARKRAWMYGDKQKEGEA